MRILIVRFEFTSIPRYFFPCVNFNTEQDTVALTGERINALLMNIRKREVKMY